eukprot:gene9708-9772_t
MPRSPVGPRGLRAKLRRIACWLGNGSTGANGSGSNAGSTFAASAQGRAILVSLL